MLFEYFYGNEALQFSFYRIPSYLILSDEFSNVSYGAKILYGLLLSRIEMSIANKWFDNQGRAYIIYSIAEVQENMNCCKATAIKMMAELEKAGLLERKRRGLGLANITYLKKFINKSKMQTFENQKSRLSQITSQEVQNIDLSDSENQIT